MTMWKIGQLYSWEMMVKNCYELYYTVGTFHFSSSFWVDLERHKIFLRSTFQGILL